MVDLLLWTICLILGVPAALLILGNWLDVVGVLVAARGKTRTISFAPPFLCGIAGALACFACPWPGVWCWAWLPPLLDPSIALMILMSILHVVARLSGLRSPFDGAPAQPSDSQEGPEPGNPVDRPCG